jgi:hypothetical protein
MSHVADKPRHAPADHSTMEPCVEISGRAGGLPWPEYAGSGVPLAEHPFRSQVPWTLSARCGGCGSERTLCVYLHYVGGLGTGQDMTVELFCRDCGRYTVDSYVD